MADVRLTPRAERDLFEIWSYISADDPAAADRLVRRIMEKADLAATRPRSGVWRPELSPTARLLVGGRYIVIYEPATNGIVVIAVVHGMRHPDSRL